MATGRGSTGDKRARKVKQRQKRLAVHESSREQHAALVNARAGDPNYVQKRLNPDGGRTLSWTDDTPGSAEFIEALAAQRQAFVDKFGREPGPNDPMMFDPDSDTPREITEEAMLADIDNLIERAHQDGQNTAYLKAWRDTGFLVTESNQHLFSAADLDQWNDAVDHHWDPSFDHDR
ncbi:hypothetical protein [Rhodococcus sp. EPR-157]|uniref:hypothetical protein n=1 Tax=Rhodococcus sp. EPR-157 TaxID=1813677 RepID=UPI0012E70B8A|nr:hypothetical protein [Rhodococcus sp. EPR-157]